MKKTKYNIIFLILIVVILLQSNSQSIAKAQSLIELNSPSAILIDAGTGKVLFEKNVNEKLEPASITKIMTLLLAFEAVDQGKANLSDELKSANELGKQVEVKISGYG